MPHNKKYSDILSGQPIIGVGGRMIAPFDDNTFFIPFRHDPAAMAYLRPDQVPRFLDAVTHPNRLPLITMPLADMIAIKSRVGRDVVEKHLDNLGDINPPVVVYMNGAFYIADGHDRLVALWLDGNNEVEVRFDNLEPFDDSKPDPKDRAPTDDTRFELLQGADGRELACYNNGTLAIPFIYDPAFFAKLRTDQVPKFLNAITHPDDQDEETVPLNSLVAIQNRVNANTVASFVEKPSKKRPVIVRINGTNYIGDGHDRLAAKWLVGKDSAAVVVKDISQLNQLMKAEDKTWNIPVQIKKVDADRQMVFGWASVSTRDGQLIVDKQNDIIEPHELENAAYEYVMHSRDGGEMHIKKGVAQCIESCVLTNEKQSAMGISLPHEAWWVGFLVNDADTWSKYKDGTYSEFSVGGLAIPKNLD